MGVASKPVEPGPQYFAGLLAYGKRKFVENLKFIGALMWKLLIFQFYTAMYILCNLEFMKKGQRLKQGHGGFYKKMFYNL